MRRTTPATIAAILALVICQEAVATTKQWSYPLPEGSGIHQVVADEVGGVAVAYFQSATSTTYLVWLDSIGREIYQRQLSGYMYPIVDVNHRVLVLQVDSENILIVDRNRGESGIANVFSQFVQHSKATDRHGFFATEMSNSIPIALVRYDY
jgi:hypothetical protein